MWSPEAVPLPIIYAMLIRFALGNKLDKPFEFRRLDTPTDGGLARFADKYGQGHA